MERVAEPDLECLLVRGVVLRVCVCVCVCVERVVNVRNSTSTRGFKSVITLKSGTCTRPLEWFSFYLSQWS